jgi:N-acetylated-alpha-linked acidic dipeptidase
MRHVLFCLFLTFPAFCQAPIRGFGNDQWKSEHEREDKATAIPQRERMKIYMERMASKPHHAGSAGSRAVAEYALGLFKEWGFDAQIEAFEALLPYPTLRSLEMTEPVRFRALLKESAVEDKEQLPTFNAYSATGDVTAPLVYVNYGVPEDYEVLSKLGIDVKGKIAIARYGHSWRGIKPKLAQENGAVGCLIYSDPRDDGYFQGEVYPNGPMRPAQGVQRGSVMDMPLYPGDPLTPGWASVPGEAAGSGRCEDDSEDSGDTDFLWRCAAAAGTIARTGGSRSLARSAADHVSRGSGTGDCAAEGGFRLDE